MNSIDVGHFGVAARLMKAWISRFVTDWRRKEAGARDERQGLIDWGRRYLPNHFRLAPSKMHRSLDAELAGVHQSRGLKLNVIGPRGAAKSTLVTLAYVLRAALEGWEPYIWIVSDSRRQACGHLENIKHELLDNAAIARDYPDAVGQGAVWQSGAVQLRSGVRIEAYGAGQRIRGRRVQANRPTLIVCDDVQNDSHMESAAQRERSLRWFEGTLLKAGSSQTNIINLATALHRDALAMRLARTPGWTSRVFQAIVRWPDDLDLWRAWENIYCDVENPECKRLARAFYDEHEERLCAGAELLWPEEENLYLLMCMRVEGGRAAFEREKQGSPTNPDLCEWPEHYFSEAIWFDEWPTAARVRTVALDPSKAADGKHGDYSAYVMLLVGEDGVLYVDADMGRRGTPQMVAEGVEICRWFQPDAFGIETNQFQELLAQEFAAELQRQGLLGLSPWMLDNRVNKRVRIRRLGPLLSSRRLRFMRRSPGASLLVEQLRDFPNADHDDGPDALEMAVRLAGELCDGSAGDGLGDRLPLSSN